MITRADTEETIGLDLNPKSDQKILSRRQLYMRPWSQLEKKTGKEYESLEVLKYKSYLENVTPSFKDYFIKVSLVKWILLLSPAIGSYQLTQDSHITGKGANC